MAETGHSEEDPEARPPRGIRGQGFLLSGPQTLAPSSPGRGEATDTGGYTAADPIHIIFPSRAG